MVDFSGIFQDAITQFISLVVGVFAAILNALTAPFKLYFSTWVTAANSSNEYGFFSPIIMSLVIVAVFIIFLWYSRKLPIIGEFLEDED